MSTVGSTATGRIEAHGLAIGYRDRIVCRGIELTMPAGSITCLLGPNGGGKTTLFRTLLGLIPPRDGRVTIDGRAIDSMSRLELARRVGYVPQSATPAFSFSAREMVLLGRTAHLGAFGAPGRDDHHIVGQALRSVGIDTLADRPVTELSGGERQLVTIARALAQQSPFIVLDEPTSSLDFGNQIRILRLLRRLADEGHGLIVSTHDPDQALSIADRVAILGQGRLLAVGPPERVITGESLASTYGVEVDVVEVEVGGRRQRLCVPRIDAGGSADRSADGSADGRADGG